MADEKPKVTVYSPKGEPQVPKTPPGPYDSKGQPSGGTPVPGSLIDIKV